MTPGDDIMPDNWIKWIVVYARGQMRQESGVLTRVKSRVDLDKLNRSPVTKPIGPLNLHLTDSLK